MGVEGRYYLRLTPTPPHCNAHCNSNPNRRYQSGATHCSAGQDPDLYVALQQGEVSKVAFGCTVHTWFVLYANGEYRWSNIDPDMEARVFRDPTCEAKTLRDVTLGPAMQRAKQLVSHLIITPHTCGGEDISQISLPPLAPLEEGTFFPRLAPK